MYLIFKYLQNKLRPGYFSVGTYTKSNKVQENIKTSCIKNAKRHKKVVPLIFAQKKLKKT
jgi:hypothetical protein